MHGFLLAVFVAVRYPFFERCGAAPSTATALGRRKAGVREGADIVLSIDGGTCMCGRGPGGEQIEPVIP
jgi:hypothetical protein